MGPTTPSCGCVEPEVPTRAAVHRIGRTCLSGSALAWIKIQFLHFLNKFQTKLQTNLCPQHRKIYADVRKSCRDRQLNDTSTTQTNKDRSSRLQLGKTVILAHMLGLLLEKLKRKKQKQPENRTFTTSLNAERNSPSLPVLAFPLCCSIAYGCLPPPTP